jgi:cation transport ATPase
MTQILFIICVAYIFTSGYFLLNWLVFSQYKASYNPEDKFLSLVILTIVTIFWPIAFVISCFKSFKTKEIEFNTLVPIIFAMAAFSFYMRLN